MSRGIDESQMDRYLNFKIDTKKYDFDVQKPKGDSYFYWCEICKTILPSNPAYPVRCACHNINLDPEMFKVGVRNYKKFTVLELVI